MDTRLLGVIGAGTMGRGIAQVMAASGYEVVLNDIDDDAVRKGLAGIDENMQRLVAKHKMSEDARSAALARIRTATRLDELAACDVVVEAATENVQLKLKIFAELDRISKPDAILASNTSSISLTRIAGATKRPPQVVGMHFFNPVPVMQLVELIRALQTSDATYDAIKALTEKLGSRPAAAASASCAAAATRLSAATISGRCA